MKTWNKKQQIALGLSNKEQRLLDALQKQGPQNTTLLAQRASLPRVTALRILSTLRERGFVVRQKGRRAVEWSLVKPALLEKRLVNLFRNTQAHNKNIELSEIGSVTIYYGVAEMLESNRRLLIAHSGERVLAVEPNGIWKHFPQDYTELWKHLNQLFKQKQILIEMVTEEGFEKVLQQQVDPGLQESFLSLAVDIRVVRGRILDSTTEILIFRDQILFTDWADLVGVEIKNPSTVRVIKAMYRLLQASGRTHKIH